MKTYTGFSMGLILLAALAAPAAHAQPGQNSMHGTLGALMRSSYLGIGVQDVDADRAKALKLKDVRGAEVTNVAPDSPAAKAGFQTGDVILDYNGQAVEGQEQLGRLVRETPVGRQVKIGVWRAGASMTLTPTIEANHSMTFSSGNGQTWTMPEIQIPLRTFNIPDIEIPRFQTMYQNPMLGIEGESLGQEEQLADFFGVKDGVLVKAVTSNSAAEKAGIKAGDVIVKVEGTHVATTREITSVLRGVRGKTTVTVTVVRNRKEMELPVTLEAQIYSPVRAGELLWFPNRSVLRIVRPAAGSRGWRIDLAPMRMI